MKQQIQVSQEMVGKYINFYGYSDINPVGKIISVKSKTTVMVQRVQVTTDSPVNMKDIVFIPGGFSAHSPNQRSQKWEFKETEETFPVRISNVYMKNHRIDEAPQKFYDFNF